MNPDAAPKYNKMEYAIDQLFAAIDNRGGDATGFVAIGDEGNVEWQKASCDAFTFYKERRPIPVNTRSVLVHTRMATQGHQAFPENNHPVRRGSVYVVHNGHVFNDHEIFRKTKRERYGQVDSEAIAAIIAKYGIMRTHKAMEEITGAAAIGVVDETRPGLMVLARGSSSPLVFYRNENIAVFASTKEAVKRAWSVLYGTPPKEKHIEDVNEGVAIYLDNNTVRREKFTPDDLYGYSRYQYGNYKGAVKYCSHNGCWKEATYDGLCPKHLVDYYDNDDITTTNYSNLNFSRAKILCEHGCEKLDCEICNPDDENGSYLPVLRKDNQKHWIDAKKCELCGNWFGEDELVSVEDWHDNEKWLFCDSCLEEMSEVIADCDVTRPQNIHDQNLEDVETVNEYLNRQGWFNVTI